MTTDVAILSFIAFFGSLIWLEKGRLPNFLIRSSLVKCILMGFILMITGMMLSVFTYSLYFPVIATIFSAQLIVWKSRKNLIKVDRKQEK